MVKEMPVVALRAWQQEALEGFLSAGEATWLTTATPGAGKTTYALAAARSLWVNGWIDRVIVVAPTDHLRTQWVQAARAAGFDLRRTPNDESLPLDADGAVVTYAQVAARPTVHADRTAARRTFVVFDEIHHAGDDRSWGAGVIDAFREAMVRFGVTGTPFRSDQARIAFVKYEPVPAPVGAEVGAAEGGPGGSVLQSRADFTYGYGDALRDGVVRPVSFAAYSGQATWRDAAGQVDSARLGDVDLSRGQEELAWKTALDPDGEWVPHVFAAAWARVRELRASTIPDAAVLIPASSQAVARLYAEVWEQVTGTKPLVILSDDPESTRRIAEFRDNPDVIAAVCVRLITEGVDIPRAAVLAYTTTSSTPLFFAQMVGRVIRARNSRERATVFLPAVRRLLVLAAEMEAERDHVLIPDAENVDEVPDAGEAERPDPVDGDVWQPVSAEAAFSTVIGTHRPEPAGDRDEMGELFGLDGLLTPEQEAALLTRDERDRQVQAREVAATRKAAREAAERERQQQIISAQWEGGQVPEELRRPEVADGDVVDVEELRSRIAREVKGYAASAAVTHQEAWSRLYARTPGPKNREASVELLKRRLATAHHM